MHVRGQLSRPVRDNCPVRQVGRAAAIEPMKYPPWLVAAVIAVAVSLVLMLVSSSSSPCRTSSALRLDGLCGAALFYASSH